MHNEENFIEIPFGARDSETLGWEYTIPDDMEATIKDGKIIVRKKESEDEEARKYLLHCVEEWEEGHCCWNSNKEAIKPLKAYLEKQKPVEWSKEDETALQDALWCIGIARKRAKDENDMGTCWSAERWLKSLMPQNRWKPTQAMVDALKWAICEFHPDCPETRDALEKLYCEINHL